MATQIATLFLRRLEVPIVLRDVDEEIVDGARASIARRAVRAGREGPLQRGQGALPRGHRHGATGWDGFEDCDLVARGRLEQLDVKKEIFAELSESCADALLATNTSSLSVDEMGARTSACTSSTRSP